MTTVRVDPEGPEAPASVLLAHYPTTLDEAAAPHVVACSCGARFPLGPVTVAQAWERGHREWAEHAVANLWPAMEANPY